MTIEKEFPQRWFVPPGYKIRTKRYYPDDVEVMLVAEHTAIISKLEDEQNEDFKNLNNANIGQYYEISKLEKENQKLREALEDHELLNHLLDTKYDRLSKTGSLVDALYPGTNLSLMERITKTKKAINKALAPPVNQEAIGDKEE